MISPLQELPLKELPLPLLIREKVEFYYYFDKWKDLIKIMHHQYYEKLQIFDGEYGFYTIDWRNNPVPFYKIGYANTICNIAGRSHRYKYIKEFYDRKGRFVNDPVAMLPEKYYYSSGLNDPTGYK
jgi:hypothetical protein